MVVLIGIDGIGSKVIIDDWAAATGSEREILTQIVFAIEHIDVAVFTTFITIQYGLVFIMIGLALWLSADHPTYLGVPALILGVLATITGITWSFIGLEDGTVLPGFGTVLTALFWTVIMGAWMLRNPPSPTPSTQSPTL